MMASDSSCEGDTTIALNLSQSAAVAMSTHNDAGLLICRHTEYITSGLTGLLQLTHTDTQTQKYMVIMFELLALGYDTYLSSQTKIQETIQIEMQEGNTKWNK